MAGITIDGWTTKVTETTTAGNTMRTMGTCPTEEITEVGSTTTTGWILTSWTDAAMANAG